MRKLFVMMLALSMTLGLMACGSNTSSADTSGSGDAAAVSETEAAAETEVAETYEEGDESTHEHTIAVLTYSRTDEEVLAFRNYLENYIASCFNVNFLYSDTIMSEEEVLDFIELAAVNGCEGIMSFNSYDLATEVALCEENEMYFMMASGSVDQEQFDAVADNPWFLGVVGPGSDAEYQAGADMASFFVEQEYGDSYFILSGGASLGNEMHLKRTEGILDTLASAYGVSFDTAVEEMAATDEIIHASAGDLEVCIVPGYIDYDAYLEPAIAEYEQDQYPNVLSVLPGSAMRDVLKDSNVGVIDCFTESNMSFFAENQELRYVCGKYGSLIGPSFAAMYNAVTGHADEFREDGKAFQIEQGFWTATSAEEYQKMYTLASSVEINAYNFDDLYSVCSVYTPGATLDDLKALATAESYEEVVARRGLE